MKSYDVRECGAPLQLHERPAPVPRGEEVLLRVLASGVCHTDLHLWDGHYDLGGGKKLRMADRGVKLPLTLGHENVGEVVAVGPDARGAAVGDRRLVYPWIGCGRCATCARGEEHLCTAPQFLGIFRAGGYADHLLVPHPRCLFDRAPSRPRWRRRSPAPGSPHTVPSGSSVRSCSETRSSSSAPVGSVSCASRWPERWGRGALSRWT